MANPKKKTAPKKAKAATNGKTKQEMVYARFDEADPVLAWLKRQCEIFGAKTAPMVNLIIEHACRTGWSYAEAQALRAKAAAESGDAR